MAWPEPGLDGKSGKNPAFAAVLVLVGIVAAVGIYLGARDSQEPSPED
jgi:hypothetical protein